jgi:hypothetical protein
VRWLSLFMAPVFLPLAHCTLHAYPSHPVLLAFILL